jgi:hypothetical protein
MVRMVAVAGMAAVAAGIAVLVLALVVRALAPAQGTVNAMGVG